MIKMTGSIRATLGEGGLLEWLEYRMLFGGQAPFYDPKARYNKEIDSKPRKKLP